jgi:two-component system nitrate/nitrite sensor histidine kinase NarX
LWEHNPVEAHRNLAKLRQLTRGALAEMRTLLLELRPATLTERPLGDLLRHLAEALTNRTKIPVEVRVDQGCAAPPEVQIAQYRIAQEALNNVAKHAGASQATLTLRCNQQRIELCIDDDGCGFDANLIPPGHLGVGIMRERAEGIGATFEVDSEPGQGTSIRVIWNGSKDERMPP